jgi:branched-subunit amino acid ABC-type transport system permease component
VYIVSLIPAVLLAWAIIRMLMAGQGHVQLAFAVLVSIVVCATHIVVLVMYPIRRTKPLAMLLGAMGCVSILCLFLLAVSGQRNYQIHSISNLPNAPSAPALK